MLRLFILRHAKSGWAEPGQGDFERSLNDQGNADLSEISKVISENGYAPATVFCSSAKRTRETLDGIEDALPKDIQVEFEESLYSGNMDAYLDIIRSQKGKGAILMVGHNPMAAGLAMQLCGKGDPDALSDVAIKFPAGTLVAIDFDVESWSDITAQSGFLHAFHAPHR